MKKTWMIISIVMILFLSMVLKATARAEEPTERIRAMLEEIMTIQTDPQMDGSEHREERRTAIKKIIGENIDFDAMAQIALDKHWQKLSPAQRNEFKQIFRDLFQDSYSRLVLNFIKREKVQDQA